MKLAPFNTGDQVDVHVDIDGETNVFHGRYDQFDDNGLTLRVGLEDTGSAMFFPRERIIYIEGRIGSGE